MEQLVRVAEQEIGLRHHLAYDNFNFDYQASGKAKTQSVSAILRVF